MPDMSAEAALPSRITQTDTSKTKPSGRFQGLRERVSKIFNGNMLVTPDETPTKTEPNIIAGRKLPEFDNGIIPPMTFPDRPEGFPRPENIGELKVIHETPDGPKINAVGNIPQESIGEAFRRIEELVPDDKRHELDLKAEKVVGAETDEDRQSILREENEPTDREYLARKAASMLALVEVSGSAHGGSFAQPDKEAAEVRQFDKLRSLAFPPVKRSA